MISRPLWYSTCQSGVGTKTPEINRDIIAWSQNLLKLDNVDSTLYMKDHPLIMWEWSPPYREIQ